MTAPALELAGLRKSFGALEIIRGVDLAIPVGERHAVIGPNGAGKSTALPSHQRSLPPERRYHPPPRGGDRRGWRRT